MFWEYGLGLGRTRGLVSRAVNKALTNRTETNGEKQLKTYY